MPILESLSEFVLALAASPWVYLIVLVVVIIDGFFPPIPSESIVVALGALAISTQAPNLIVLVLVTAVGAVIGDSLAYLIGRHIGLDRFQWMQRPRIRAGIDRARTALDRRAATLLLTARYVPVGRVIVNMTAGATGFRLRRYLPLALLSAIGWSLCTVFIGVLAGTWLRDNPVLGAVVAIAIAFGLGLLVDAVLSLVARRRDAGQMNASGAGSGADSGCHFGCDCAADSGCELGCECGCESSADSTCEFDCERGAASCEFGCENGCESDELSRKLALAE